MKCSEDFRRRIVALIIRQLRCEAKPFPDNVSAVVKGVPRRSDNVIWRRLRYGKFTLRSPAKSRLIFLMKKRSHRHTLRRIETT